MIFDAFSQTLLTEVSHIISSILCAKQPLLIWQRNPHHSARGASLTCSSPSALWLSLAALSPRDCLHSLHLCVCSLSYGNIRNAHNL